MDEKLIQAIPVKYNGVQFRSRQEAKWAAFFDLCGWTWDFEPMDLKGWIPDFILEGVDCDIFVEVKSYKKLEDFDEAILKIKRSGIKERILLLGEKPFGAFYSWDAYSIGWYKEYGNSYDSSVDFSEVGFGVEDKKHRKYKYLYDIFWWPGDGDGNDRTILNNGIYNYSNNEFNYSNPIPLWKEAKNMVQWFPKKVIST